MGHADLLSQIQDEEYKQAIGNPASDYHCGQVDVATLTQENETKAKRDAATNDKFDKMCCTIVKFSLAQRDVCTLQ